MGKKLFFEIQSINIMYPNEENMIVVPITKRMEIIASIQAFLIFWMNINYKEIMDRKAYLANPKHQYRVPNV